MLECMKENKYLVTKDEDYIDDFMEIVERYAESID
jgi:hypothetical protein